MLRPNEYSYRASHLVVERGQDRDNLCQSGPRTNEVADYSSVIRPTAQPRDWHAISHKWKDLLWKPALWLLTKEQRCFAERRIEAMRQRLAERAFRRVVDNFKEVIVLSHQPCREGEQGQVSQNVLENEKKFLPYNSIFPFSQTSAPKPEPLAQQQLDGMDLNDYGHYLESQRKSYEESMANDVDGRYSILFNRKTTNKADVDAWLEFIDIQVRFCMRNEDTLLIRFAVLVAKSIKSRIGNKSNSNSNWRFAFGE
jgi:hypothetical protein